MNMNYLLNKRGEAYIGTGVKIIIAVVVGAVVLGGIFLLFNSVIFPKMNSTVSEYMEIGDAASANEQKQVYQMLNADTVVSGEKDAQFWSSAETSKLKHVSVDGFMVSPSHYTVIPGYTIVTLQKDYIATLSDGNHTLRIVSEDGYAEATFEKVTPITFTIQGVGTYTALPGMTWGEWILSYQMSSSSNGIVWVQDRTLELYVDIGNGLWVNSIKNQRYTDEIVDGMTYTVIGPA